MCSTFMKTSLILSHAYYFIHSFYSECASDIFGVPSHTYSRNQVKITISEKFPHRKRPSTAFINRFHMQNFASMTICAYRRGHGNRKSVAIWISNQSEDLTSFFMAIKCASWCSSAPAPAEDDLKKSHKIKWQERRKKEDESIVETDCTLNLLLIAKLAMRCCTSNIFTLPFQSMIMQPQMLPHTRHDETQLFKLVATIELCTRNKVQHVLRSLDKSFRLTTHFSPFHFPFASVPSSLSYRLLRRRSLLGSEKFRASNAEW